MALYLLSYPGSINGTGLNLSLEKQCYAMSEVRIPVQVKIFPLKSEIYVISKPDILNQGENETPDRSIN